MAKPESVDWESILREHGADVWRTIYRLVGDHAEASDCLQETFLSAMKVAQRGKVLSWEPLLKKLAVARAIDALRRRLRYCSRTRGSDSLASASADTADPLVELEAKELRENLLRALARLPGKQAEAFCLRHLDGLSYREVAEQLQMRTGAVRVTLHRACKNLRALLNTTAADDRK